MGLLGRHMVGAVGVRTGVLSRSTRTVFGASAGVTQVCFTLRARRSRVGSIFIYAADSVPHAVPRAERVRVVGNSVFNY